MKRLILASIALILLLPLIFMGPKDELTLSTYLLKCALPCTLLLVFWMNYLWIFPSYDKHESKNRVIWQNLLLVMLCSAFLVMTHRLEFNLRTPPTHAPHHFEHVHPKHGFHPHHDKPQHQPQHLRDGRRDRHDATHFIVYTGLRDGFILTLVIFVAYGIQAARRISRLKREQQEADAARQEAELKELRQQVSPHFLLNTLNNIYSLSLLNNPKASQAIMELSSLLRHTLYESQNERVSLTSEAHFLLSYVQLMQLRLPTNVQVNTQIDINENSQTQIASLLFISLIENAFKHGVAPACPCHIDIRLEENEVSIHLRIANSLHPKSQEDRSGHGIGLLSVKKRLDYYYPDTHHWTYGPQQDEWITDLTINHKNIKPYQ